MKAMLADMAERAMVYVSYGLPGGLGAGANYLYLHASKGKPLSMKGLIIFVLLGSFTVNMIGPHIPVDMPGRDGALFGLGFMFWPILAALDSKGGAFADYFVSKFGSK